MNEQALLQDARRYLAMIHKRRGVVVTAVGVSLLVALLYNYTTRPIYQATAQILIDRDTPNVLPNKELVAEGLHPSSKDARLEFSGGERTVRRKS